MISSQAEMHQFADDDSQEQSPCNKILEFDDSKGCQEEDSHDETSAMNESEVALSSHFFPCAQIESGSKEMLHTTRHPPWMHLQCHL